MRYLRSVAALAAILTVSALQAALISPIAGSLPVSLPAVLVACVALADGAAVGMTFGFIAGLIADLGSSHPAGVLALTWTCLGVVCGMAATARSLREDVLTAATGVALTGAASSVLLAVVHSGGASTWGAIRDLAPCWVVAAALSCALVPLTRAFLNNSALRAAHPVLNEVRVVNRG
ncbi:MAG TPA: rod shape-determining protein MreD [Jatrophihabitantaceae bacterium]|jgi:rod shape-determining protein MreD|nr:rod shape-determining protein MreD [Jatrophihabitantaceae bacterium]